MWHDRSKAKHLLTLQLNPVTIRAMAANTKSFSKKEAIRFGWEITKKNFWFLLGIILVSCGIQFIPNLLTSYLKDQDLLLGITNIVVYVVSLGVSLGALKIYLSFVDGKKPQFSDLFSLFDPKLIFRYFLTSLLFGLLAVVGLILLIIPGIYFMYKYLFITYSLVDKNTGVFESFTKSSEITKGVIWDLFVFGLIIGLIVIAGFLALGVGLLVAMPVASLAMAHVYRKLSPKVK